MLRLLLVVVVVVVEVMHADGPATNAAAATQRVLYLLFYTKKERVLKLQIKEITKGFLNSEL